MDISKVTVTYADGSTKDFETVDALVAEHAPEVPEAPAESTDAPEEAPEEAPAE